MDRLIRANNEPQLLIRPATAHDAHALASLYVEAWQQLMADHHRSTSSGEARTESLEVHWRADLQSSASRAGAMLVYDDRTPVGFCAWKPATDPDAAAEIVGLYLRRAYRGHREGQVLLDATVTAMRRMGYGAAIVWVWATAPEVQRFFERLGFHADAERHGSELGQPLHQFRLQRALFDAAMY